MVTTTATDTVAVAPVDVVVSVTVTGQLLCDYVVPLFSRKVAWCRCVADTFGVVTEAVDAVVTTSDGMPSPVFFWGPPPTSFFI